MTQETSDKVEHICGYTYVKRYWQERNSCPAAENLIDDHTIWSDPRYKGKHTEELCNCQLD
jgi:hypothetical protein